jgi:hypothetical protein
MMSEQLPGTQGDLQEAYDYTIADFDTMLSCPVCAAKKLDTGIGEPKTMYTKGQVKACVVVLALGKHECDEFKGKKEAEIR